MDYKVRPYDASDDDFVWRLHLETNQSYIDRHMNVDENNVRKAHEERVNASQGFIIESDNQPIACYFVLNKPDYYELGRFFIVAEKRGKGLGTEIIKPVLDAYATTKKPILIHVWKDNPVQEFWSKLGFVFHSFNGPFADMIYRGTSS